MTMLAPRPPTPTYDDVPQRMRERKQWVVFYTKLTGKTDPFGRPKRDKVPVNPATLEPASTTAPDTWGSFDQAVAALVASNGRFAGIGYVFAEDDPFTGIDLDSVIDPNTSEIAAWALAVVERFASYTEISISKSGLHIIVEGVWGNSWKKRDGFEVYDRERFFTVSGVLFTDAPTVIAARQDELDQLHAEHAPEPVQAPPRPEGAPGRGGSMTDRYALRLAHLLTSDGGKWQRVFAGDYSDYPGPDGLPDRSRARQGVINAMVARWMEDGEIIAALAGTEIYLSLVQDKGKHADWLIDREIGNARGFASLLPTDPGAPPATIDLNDLHGDAGADEAPFQDDTVPKEEAGPCLCCTGCATTIAALRRDLAAARAVIAGEREERERITRERDGAREWERTRSDILANGEIGATERIAIAQAIPMIYSRTSDTDPDAEPITLYVGTGKDDGFASRIGGSRRTALKVAERLNEIGVLHTELIDVKKTRPDGSEVEYKEVRVRPLYATPIEAARHAAVWQAPEGKAKNGHGGARKRECATCPGADIEQRMTVVEMEKTTTTYICRGCGDVLGEDTDTKQIRTRTFSRTAPGAPRQDEKVVNEKQGVPPASPDVIGTPLNCATDAGCSTEAGRMRTRLLDEAEAAGWPSVLIDTRRIVGEGMWSLFAGEADVGRLAAAFQELQRGEP
jgi:hypothetical protein